MLPFQFSHPNLNESKNHTIHHFNPNHRKITNTFANRATSQSCLLSPIRFGGPKNGTAMSMTFWNAFKNIVIKKTCRACSECDGLANVCVWNSRVSRPLFAIQIAVHVPFAKRSKMARKSANGPICTRGCFFYMPDWLRGQEFRCVNVGVS